MNHKSIMVDFVKCRMKRRTILLALIFILEAKSYLSSQPAAYTQWWNAPQQENPALTAFGIEKYRLDGVYQTRSYENAPNLNTLYLSASYRFNFENTNKEYGLVVPRSNPLSIGIGIFSERRFADTTQYPYAIIGASFDILAGFGGTNTLAVGLQPYWFESEGYYPVSKIYFQSNDTLLPGHSPHKKFGVNVGILLGINKMDCWTDDQVHRFEIGMAIYRLSMPYRTLIPDIHPGKEIHSHAGYLLHLSQKLGMVFRTSWIYEGQHLYNGGFSLIYRRHFAFADRFRMGIYYSNTYHLSLTAGFRIYTPKTSTLSLDLEMSRDFALKNQQNMIPWHQNAWEIAFIVKPIKKCWSLDNCSRAYQYEGF